MEPTTSTRDTKKIDCTTCGHEYTPACDFMQGRCPHHTALVDVKAIKTRFTNLLNFLKGIK